MNRSPASREGIVLASIGLLLVVIPVIDALTPLGYAEWALYFLPVALTIFQSRPAAPFLVAAIATALSGFGMVASAAGVDPMLAAVNRGLGSAAVWLMAVVIWLVIRGRRDMQRVLWLQQGQAAVGEALRGELAPGEVAVKGMRALADWLGAEVAAVYRAVGTEMQLVGGVALDEQTPRRLPLDTGLFGESVRTGQPRHFEPLPEPALGVATAFGRSRAASHLVGPITADGQPTGGVEVALMRRPDDPQAALDLLRGCAEIIGTALRSAEYRVRLVELLQETQAQSEELQTQQEELRVTNEELEEQGRALQRSQAELESQQAELEATNVQLEEQTQLLERQKADLLRSQDALQRNAESLEAASRYKSEFLANMSHELRTPLNSSLILAKLLADNKEGTLLPEQVRYAQAIHASNNDLLALINDILDLSKIEAGHLDFAVDTVSLSTVVGRLRDTFEPLTAQKALAFRVEVADTAPAELVTDVQRLQQVLKNLLANAVKFTDRGEVSLRVEAAGPGRLRFTVCDTGVGIARHQQALIFEAFRQADGSTSRRFGGTGLGLSISRELAHRMHGEITVESEPGRGSCFTLELPQDLSAALAEGGAPPAPAPATPAAVVERPVVPAAPAGASPPSEGAAVPDDRARRSRPGRLILAVEDDPAFAQALVQLAHELDFDCVVAGTAAEALRLAAELSPSGILLDIKLPDASGLTVLERLKRDPATRHLPVHMMSSLDRTQTAMELGAVGYVPKPASRDALVEAIGRLEHRLQRSVRHLLIVEDDAALRDNLKLLLAAENLEITAVGTVREALDHLARRSFDCMVTDLTLPDGSGYDLLERMAAGEQLSFPPVIVYTGRALTRDEEQRLRRHSKSIIVKGARSPERLLDEVTLFLHSVEATLPADQQKLLRQARRRDSVLDGRTLLLAEDDVRNIFALSSVFEPLGATLAIARNGREAIERLEKGDIDLVLMDIMMPEMDGLAAMRHIRADSRWRALPIIALTAKAMPDDREHCIEAGASDYIAKPIDVDKLVSLCRVWCPK